MEGGNQVLSKARLEEAFRYLNRFRTYVRSCGEEYQDSLQPIGTAIVACATLLDRLDKEEI